MEHDCHDIFKLEDGVDTAEVDGVKGRGGLDMRLSVVVTCR